MASGDIFTKHATTLIHIQKSRDLTVSLTLEGCLKCQSPEILPLAIICHVSLRSQGMGHPNFPYIAKTDHQGDMPVINSMSQVVKNQTRAYPKYEACLQTVAGWTLLDATTSQPTINTSIAPL
eukprot:scaffold30137_cov62-Attheya_sp.AAC.3